MARAETQKLVSEMEFKDKGFSRGVDNAIAKTNKLDSTLSKVGDRASKGLSTAASNLGKIATIGAGVGVGLLAASVVEASSLNEELSKSTVVFGKASKEVIAFSETTAESLGLAQSE